MLRQALIKKLSKKYRRIIEGDVKDIEIVRRSFDGRGDHVQKVYTLDFTYAKKLNLPEVKQNPTTSILNHILEAKHHPQNDQINCETSSCCDEKTSRPVIVGFGPCGMFSALVLARAGLKPIVLERGLDVDRRIEKVERFWKTGELDTECNVQFGEGGAGTFSDGKLNTGIKDPRARFVLETFVEAGANPEILIDARPHIGTDALRSVVKNIREEIISLGGEVRFGTRLVRILLDNGIDDVINDTQSLTMNAEHNRGNNNSAPISVKGVVVSTDDNSREVTIETATVVLAIGHSARDTVRLLHSQGISMEPKPFSMGVRVEHPQELIDRGLYGEDAGHPDLPPAYYKLSTKANDGRGVYSFCMCPGGEIVNAASQEGGVVTNGMSNSKRDSGFANSGILVDVRPEDYLSFDVVEETECPPELKGVLYQEHYERLAFENGGGTYAIPTTTWGEYEGAYRAAKSNPVTDSLPDFVAGDIHEAMPVFGRRIKGFDNPETIIKAIESRSSSPVRILRNPHTLEGILSCCDEQNLPRADRVQAIPLNGFYPGGEGAGYAGGITSAACDGIKIAETIISAINEKSDK